MDQNSLSKLAQVHPELARRAKLVIAALAPHDVRVGSGLRTYTEQNALYAQGRTKPGKKVTNARGGQSNHNFGLALDLTIFDADGNYLPDSPLYDLIRPAAHAAGLESGADWKHINDRPHIQLPSDLIVNGSPTNECRVLYAKGGLPAIFAHVSAAEPAGEPGSPTEDTGGGSPVVSNPTSTEQPPILKRGSYGTEVIALQTKLRSLKYTLEINGRYDERTAYIVGKFQGSNHLEADGIVGKDTRRALGL